MSGAPLDPGSLEPASAPGRATTLLVGPAGAGLLFAMLVGAVFTEVLFAGRALFVRDIHAFWLPSVEGFVRAVGGGEWPVWDPHIGFGKPLLADPGEQAAYPPTWLNLILFPITYYKLFAVAHLIWAAFGSWLLARRWGFPPAGALAAGAVWCVSGPLLSAVSLWHHFAGTAWLPWVLLALERALARPTAASAAWLGGAAALQALAGSADLCVMTGMLCAVRALAGWRRVGTGALLRIVGISVAVAAGLGAVQWAATLSTIAGSSRTAYGPGANAYWSLYPARLLELWVPVSTGLLPITSGLRELVFEGREPFLVSLYLGAPAAGFVLLGLRAGARPGRARWALGAGFAFFLAAALGRHTPLYDALFSIPPVSLLRYPVKFLFVASLLWALLVGVGASTWVGRWERADARWARLVAGLVLAWGLLLGGTSLAWARGETEALAWMLRPELVGEAARRMAGSCAPAALACGLWAALLWVRAGRVQSGGGLTAAALGVALLDLALPGRSVNPHAPPELVSHRPSLLGTIEADPAPRRLQVVSPSHAWLVQNMVYWPEGWSGDSSWALGALQRMEPPIGARWGLDGSYSADFTGQEPVVFGGMADLALRTQDQPMGLRLLRIGGVTHVIAFDPGIYGGLPELASLESVYTDPIRLFRVPDPLPRAYAVDGVRIAGEPRSYTVITDPSFDPEREVVLPSGREQPHRPGFRSAVRLLWRRTASVGLEAELSAPGLVVLLDAWRSGWTAEVDGRPTRVQRGNLLFRAVEVPAGLHRVILRYRPPEVVWGVRITLATLAGLAAWAAWRVRGAGRARRG